MPHPPYFSTTARHHFHYQQHHHIRTFINATIKWVRDPYLDTAVEREKNLKPLLSLKTLITSQPSQTLPLSQLNQPHLNLPTPLTKFIQNYPLIFKTFLPPHKPPRFPHVKLTPRALSLHKEESLVLGTSGYRRDLAERLTRLLMITRRGKMPLGLIELVRYDLGLQSNYLLSLVSEFPDYFQICDMGEGGGVVFGLELVCWRGELAVSVMERRVRGEAGVGKKVRFSMDLPNGFDLEKRVVEWVDEWQNLPYISPYENAFHLAPNGDQAEKWAVGVIHELLSLLVSKKIEREVVFCLGEFWGFERLRFKRALVHFPGIFYVSNKIKTQTVVLREAFQKKFLIEQHPLMDMRNKYISLMNLVLRRGKPIRNEAPWYKKRQGSLPKGGRKKVDGNRMIISDDD